MVHKYRRRGQDTDKSTRPCFYSDPRWILILCFFLVGAAPTRVNTYTSGETISSSAVTANEDAIFNYLQSGVDTYSDSSISNSAVSGSANVQCTKLNLTACSQAISNASTIKSTRTTDIGWSIVAGANTACNTTCTNACVFGFEDTNDTIVGCTDATADKCLCAGSS